MKTLRHSLALLLLALLPARSGAEEGAAPALPSPATPAAAEPAAVPGAPTKAKSKPMPSALANVSGVNVPLTPRFRLVRERIDALFHERLETPAPPDPRFNPFRAPGAAPIAIAMPSTSGEAAPPAPPSNDVITLQQAVAQLKFRGLVERNGRLQVSLNSGIYKERDVINLTVQDQPVHLRVRQITRSSVMLSLNDAEDTMRF